MKTINDSSLRESIMSHIDGDRISKDNKTKYYKVINANFGVPGIQTYQIGLNVSSNFNVEEKDGIYFTDIKHIFAYINYGPIIAELIVPDDVPIHRYDERMSIDSELIPGYFAEKVVIEKFYDKNVFHHILSLIIRGADVSCDDYAIIKYALMNNKYLFDKFKRSPSFGRVTNHLDIDKVIREYYGLGDE